MIPFLHGAIGKASFATTPPVAGYKLWLDAYDATSFTFSSGTSVSQWNDKSGNGYHFTQGTAANQPSRSGTQNGNSTVVFDGTNDYLTSNQAASVWKFMNDGTTDFTVIMALSAAANCDMILGDAYSSTGTGYYLYGNGSSGVNSTIVRGTSATYVFDGATAANWYTANTFFALTHLVKPNDATAANRSEFLNNNANSSKPNTKTGAPNNANPAGTLLVGSTFSNPGYFNGSIGEILIYPSLLSAGDLSSIQSYLSAKWAV